MVSAQLTNHSAVWLLPQANAALISHVIRYNATDKPFKQAAFPQYQYPQAKQRYAELADMLGLGGAAADEKVIRLIEAVEDLKRQCGVPVRARPAVCGDLCNFYASFQDCRFNRSPRETEGRLKGRRFIAHATEVHPHSPPPLQATIREIVGAAREAEYMASLDEMAENAFDDQCTGANPRYPLIADLKQMVRRPLPQPAQCLIPASAWCLVLFCLCWCRPEMQALLPAGTAGFFPFASCQVATVALHWGHAGLHGLMDGGSGEELTWTALLCVPACVQLKEAWEAPILPLTTLGN
jgi:hypothetical protein